MSNVRLTMIDHWILDLKTLDIGHWTLDFLKENQNANLHCIDALDRARDREGQG